MMNILMEKNKEETQMSYSDYLDYWMKEYFEINYKYSTAKRYRESFDAIKKIHGSYAGTDVIKYPFKIIHHELQIKNCRFYDLRGSYATKCLRNGVEIKDVADILGHKRIETTENYYISSTIEDRQKASAVLENIIQSDITDKIINFEEFVKKVE